MSQKNLIEKLQAAARPAILIVFDVEGPIPPLHYDGVHHDAWVIARVARQPRAMRVVDASRGVDAWNSQLHEIATQCLSWPVAPARPLDDATLPRISVVVPTIAQRESDLDACLESLTAQRYPDFDIILVDNRQSLPSLDPLRNITTRWPRVRMLYEPRRGISAARNCGISHAQGDVIAFTDDDVVVAEDWLMSIGSEFARRRDVDVVTGLILPAELETPAQLWFEMYYGGFAGERTFEAQTVCAPRRHASRLDLRRDDGHLVRTFALYGAGTFGAGANMAFRASALAARGGFDVALGTGTPSRGGEDLAMLMNILWEGGQIRYQPEAYVWHRHRRTYDELLKQLDGYGIGFTAAMTSLIVRDPRHLLALARNGPAAVRELARTFVGNFRGRGRTAAVFSRKRQFPSEMVMREYRAYFRGPAAYLRSRRQNR